MRGLWIVMLVGCAGAAAPREPLPASTPPPTSGPSGPADAAEISRAPVVGGRVTGVRAGGPLADVAVSLHPDTVGWETGFSTRTRADGTYEVVVPTGTYRIDFYYGYASFRRHNIEIHGTATIDMELDEAKTDPRGFDCTTPFAASCTLRQ